MFRLFEEQEGPTKKEEQMFKHYVEQQIRLVEEFYYSLGMESCYKKVINFIEKTIETVVVVGGEKKKEFEQKEETKKDFFSQAVKSIYPDLDKLKKQGILTKTQIEKISDKKRLTDSFRAIAKNQLNRYLSSYKNKLIKISSTSNACR